MSVDLETPPHTHESGIEWQTFKSTNVTLHVQTETTGVDRAPEDLRKGSRLVSALQHLLKPDPDTVGGPAEIFVVVAMDSQGHPPEYPADACVVLQKSETDDFNEQWSVAVTRCLIERWFGASAGSAAVFVQGIAGLAAGNAGVGPSADEADTWVRAELNAGRKVAVALPEHANKQASELTDRADHSYNLAATSLIAFLDSNYGPEKLHRYLSQYDSCPQRPGRRNGLPSTAGGTRRGVVDAAWSSGKSW